MDRRLAVGVVVLIVFVGISAYTSGQQTHDSFAVDQLPSDTELQREDEVVVSESFADIEQELRLVTHRVDSIRGRDDVRSRVQFRLKRQNLSMTRDTSRLVRLKQREAQVLGFEESAGGLPDAEALAYADPETDEREVTIYLPKPSRVTGINGISYTFVIAHELGGVFQRDRETTSSERRAPSNMTTDYILARRGISEGVASHVAAEYTEQYGGTFDPSALQAEQSDHPYDKVTQWTYYEGYEFAEKRDLITSEDISSVRSTRALLYSERSDQVRGLPNELLVENLDSVNDSVYTDRPGPLVVRTLLTSRGVDFDHAETIVAGWRNGRVDRYLAEGTIVSAWTTVWANETAATTFAGSYEANVPVTRAASFDREQCVSTDRLLLVDERRVTVVRCS